MSETRKVALPSINTAVKDLQEFERKHQASLAKSENLSKEIDALKADKQVLKLTLDKNKKTITYYQNIHVDTMAKIEKIMLSQNQGKLLAASNLEQAKRIEATLKNNKIHLNTVGIKIPQNSGLKSHQEDLQSQKAVLKATILANNRKMQELLHNINFNS